MKINLTFKTPDVLDYHVEDAVEGLDDEAREAVIDKINAVAEKYIRYGEYITIELDTETSTATVLPVRK